MNKPLIKLENHAKDFFWKLLKKDKIHIHSLLREGEGGGGDQKVFSRIKTSNRGVRKGGKR